MRTVDPDFWYKKVKKPLNVTRPIRIGTGASVLEKRLRSSLRDALGEYCRNSSLAGVRFIIDKNNPKIFRWCYSIALMMAISTGALVIAGNVQWYAQRPHLIVNEQIVQNPLDHISFPAVAICSNNIISLSALEEYGQFIYSMDRNNTYSVKEIKRNLLAFGALHTYSPRTFDFRFAKYLKDTIHHYNVTDILYKLSPDCVSMLAHCSWRARRVRCQRLFAKRITSIGFCCVFNSRYHPADRNSVPHKANLLGEDYGLTVVVRDNPEDFTYTNRPGNSFDVFLFDGTQYPLARSGVIRRVTAARNASVYVHVTAYAQQAAKELSLFSDEWLGCHLTRPGHTAEDSWSWCVSLCRMRASLALCLCAPHTVPPFSDVRILPCSLEHLACLAKHTDKFTSVYPGDYVHESLSEEQSNSIECSECKTDCARQRYSARVSTVPHDHELAGDKMFLNRLLKGVDLTDTTILRVYYATDKQQLYLLETSVRWYEAIAFMDSQWVAVVGITAVSVAELFYHCTFRWHHHYTRRQTPLRF